MEFDRLIGEAFRRRGLEVTLEELCDAIGEGAVLQRVEEVRSRIHVLGLEIVPGLGSGGVQDLRVLRPVEPGTIVPERLLAEARQGESFTKEFKSSLQFDRRRSENDPDATDADLRSEDVLNATLRTIAAFVNSDGGTLLVGVKDDGTIAGIEDDFRYCRGGTDGWELHLRNCVDVRFKDGTALNDFIRIGFCQLDGKTVARIDVVRREELCYLTMGGRYCVFRRQGNRTTEVGIEELLAYDRRRRANLTEMDPVLGTNSQDVESASLE